MKKYEDCIMEDSQCGACSLVNYGRDCHNNSVKYSSQEAWQKKVGLVSKSYKLSQELVNEFANACDKKGVSQAKQLSEMMENFIEQNK